MLIIINKYFKLEFCNLVIYQKSKGYINNIYISNILIVFFRIKVLLKI